MGVCSDDRRIEKTYFYNFKFLEKCLTDHHRSGTLDRIRTGRDIVALARLCHGHKTISIRLREWFSKSRCVKYRPRTRQRNVITSPLDGSLRLVYCRYSSRLASVTTIRIIDTSLSISKNAECPPIARCSEYFDKILVSFSSCMLVELLEYTVKNQKTALNFQTADAIWSFGPCLAP